MPLLECVPNVSEGRRHRVVDTLAGAASSAGAVLLDRSSDPDHHRTVLTLAGTPEALQGGVLALFESALAQLDLRRHRGAHPRIGAVDVVPFIALGGSPPSAASELASTVAEEVATRFAIPVFLYGEAARDPSARELAGLRRGGVEGLAKSLASGVLRPDFGPRRLHPTAGATAIGARPILIAFNVVLATPDVSIARVVAARVREAGGGLPAVRALGVFLESRGLAQVSMNLLDYRRSSPHLAFERVREEAKRVGVGVVGSEIVGLVPEEALAAGPIEELTLEGFRRDQILEQRLRHCALG